MFTNNTPQIFEVPYVEKYRPVTLEDVVGMQLFNIKFCRQHCSN